MSTQLKNTVLVFVGGALGTAARYSIGLAFDQFWMLFTVNVLGTAVLGFVNGKEREEWVSSFLGSGFAGGFTTMSGVSILIALSSFADLALASSFVLAMLGAGFAAYLIGLRLAVFGK